MLGLPVLSASAGFIPTAVFFILVWLFMATTGLLLLEVNLWYDDETHIVTMAERTLGKWGKAAAWFLFLYLFYSIMVAYTQGAGSLFSDFISDYSGIILPDWIGGLAISLLFGGLIYQGTTTVDFFNRLLMLGLVATYILLLVIGTPHVQPEILLEGDWEVAPLLIPAMVISFGFHNLVASLSTYMHHDVKALKKDDPHRKRNAAVDLSSLGSSHPRDLYAVRLFPRGLEQRGDGRSNAPPDDRLLVGRHDYAVLLLLCHHHLFPRRRV